MNSNVFHIRRNSTACIFVHGVIGARVRIGPPILLAGAWDTCEVRAAWAVVAATLADSRMSSAGVCDAEGFRCTKGASAAPAGASIAPMMPADECRKVEGE